MKTYNAVLTTPLKTIRQKAENCSLNVLKSNEAFVFRKKFFPEMDAKFLKGSYGHVEGNYDKDAEKVLVKG